MMIRIKNKMLKFNINDSNYVALVYIVGSSLAQAIEIFLGSTIHISMFFMGFFLVSLIYNVIEDKKINKKFAIQYLLCIFGVFVYYFLFYNFFTLNFGWARAAIICILICPLIYWKISYKNFTKWNKIENIFILYIIINLLFYLSNNCIWFANEALVIRYKGASNNPNQFAAIVFSFLLIEFWSSTKKSYLIKIFSIFLIVLTGSRLYILLGTICFIVSIFNNHKLTKKHLVILFSVFVCAITIFIYFFIKTNLLNRFLTADIHGLNGRAYLYISAINVFTNTNLFEFLFGLSLSERYYALSILTPTHSFTESSFFAMLVLFGLVGVIICIYYIYVGFMSSKEHTYKLIFFSVLIVFFLNDISLYPQGFVCFNIGLRVLATDSRKLLSNM